MTSLIKLSDVKGNEEKYTLLHYLVHTIEKKLPKWLNFEEEILFVDEAVCLNVKAIQETLDELATSSESLQKALSEVNLFHDNIFIEEMSPFSLESLEKVEILKEQMNRLQNSYRKAGEYYVFNICK